MPITLDELKRYRMREGAHLNFGGGSYGYDYCCIEEPRLTREIRSIKPKGKKPGIKRDEYLVDGHAVAGLEEAVERLNSPPREPPPEVAARQAAFTEMRARLNEKAKERR